MHSYHHVCAEKVSDLYVLHHCGVEPSEHQRAHSICPSVAMVSDGISRDSRRYRFFTISPPLCAAACVCSVKLLFFTCFSNLPLSSFPIVACDCLPNLYASVSCRCTACGLWKTCRVVFVRPQPHASIACSGCKPQRRECRVVEPAVFRAEHRELRPAPHRLQRWSNLVRSFFPFWSFYF